MNSAFAYKYDNNDYEIINGEIYMMAKPSMNHQRIAGNIYSKFKQHLKGKRCEAIIDQDVHLSENNNFVPDVMIVCDPEIVEDDGIHGAPDLVVEILSPSTARRDKNEKFFAYEKYGVKEYWIVSPEAKSVDVYLLKDGKFVLDDVYSIYPDYEMKRLSDEEKAEVKYSIKVSLYDDLEVPLVDIFERVK
ncbi:MAG: Uma2 family endonuclease [Selenomonadaceae bacterium]|nr:Uma2 family endonuclease [Selenomonadaceae bacterium]MBR1858114.1 Uma2 family endonuclease [Selenomonadaceae bacterium]